MIAADCAPFLSIGVTAEEARFWSRRPRSRDVFFAISSTLHLADVAPAEVWESLALTRLGNLNQFAPLVDEYATLVRDQPGLAELEILFNAEVSEVRDEVAGVLALGRYGSQATRDWFTQLTRVPTRVYLFARVLAEFPGAGYDLNRGFIRLSSAQLIKLNLARLRRRLGPGAGWRALISRSRLLAGNLIEQRFHVYKHQKHAVTSDVERMGEWALDRLAPRHDGEACRPAEIPAHWTKFYDSLFDAVDAPAFRQSRDAQGLTEGDRILVGLFRGAGHEMLRTQILAHGDGTEWEPGHLLTAALAQAYADDMVSLDGGARALSLIFDAMGFSVPSGSDLRKHFARHLGRTLGESLREYYPVTGRGLDAGEVVEPVAEPTPALTRVTPDVIALTRAAEPVGAPRDDLPVFAAIAPDREYRVHFRRPHAKFSGTQRVRFTRTALDEIAGHVEVDPDAWLEALRMGIALSHGQRGVKLLVFGLKRASGEGRPAAIKLLLSNYRVTGDFCGGVWTFDGLTKGH